MKKTSIIVALLLLILAVPSVALAFSYESRENIIINSDQIIEGNVYAIGKNITVSGKISGDLICLAETVNIKGNIGGDIICAGDTINVESEIGGNVRLVGNNIYINSVIGKNINLITASTIIGNDTHVGWDALLIGDQAEVRGKVNGNLHGYLSKLTLSGQVVRDLSFTINSKNKNSGLRLENGAQILGSLNYKSEKEADIDQGASISGETNFTKIENPGSLSLTMNFLRGKLISIFSAFILALVIISIWKNKLTTVYKEMENFRPCLGWGAIVLFLTPIISALLALTMIGIPTALIIFALWLILIYIAKILLAIFIGRKILERFWIKYKENQILAIVIGVLALWLVISIPVLGWLLNLMAIIWGMGALFMYWRSIIR